MSWSACSWLLFWLWLACPGFAFADAPWQDFQTWTQVQGGAPVAPVLHGLSANLEATVRRGSLGSVDPASGQKSEAGLTYLFVRPSLSLAVLRQLELTLGYAYAPVFYDDGALREKRDVREQRVWEQVTLKEALGPVEVASRTRLEERMRSRGPGASDLELRLRERLRAAVWLAPGQPWQLVSTDELLFFMNESSFESVPGLSEDRAFLGVGYSDRKRVAVEVGYMNQLVRGLVDHARDNHCLSTSVSVAFR